MSHRCDNVMSFVAHMSSVAYIVFTQDAITITMNDYWPRISVHLTNFRFWKMFKIDALTDYCNIIIWNRNKYQFNIFVRTEMNSVSVCVLKSFNIPKKEKVSVEKSKQSLSAFFRRLHFFCLFTYWIFPHVL